MSSKIVSDSRRSCVSTLEAECWWDALAGDVVSCSALALLRLPTSVFGENCQVWEDAPIPGTAIILEMPLTI